MAWLGSAHEGALALSATNYQAVPVRTICGAGVPASRPRRQDDRGAASGREPLQGQRILRGGAELAFTDAGGIQRRAGQGVLNHRGED